MAKLIKKKGRKNYYADLRSLGRGEVSTGCSDRRAADQVFARFLREATAPGGASAHEASRHSLADALEYLIAHGCTECSPATIGMYAAKAGHLLRLLGDIIVNDITRDLVRGYIETRQDEGASNCTIKKELVPLSRALKEASARGLFDGDARVVIPPLKNDYVPRTRRLDEKEFEALLAELAPERQLFVLLSCYVGGRQSEIEGINWETVDLERGALLLPGTKTRKARRWVPIPRPLHGLLVAIPPDDRRGLVVGPWPHVWRDLDRACERAGIPRATSNDLRRTFASWLKNASVDSKAVADLLGHTTTRMVDQVYGHLDMRTLHEAVEALPDAPGGVAYVSHAHAAGADSGGRIGLRPAPRSARGSHGNPKKKPPRLPSTASLLGGATQIRTGDRGFADLCLTAWLWRPMPLV